MAFKTPEQIQNYIDRVTAAANSALDDRYQARYSTGGRSGWIHIWDETACVIVGKLDPYFDHCTVETEGATVEVTRDSKAVILASRAANSVRTVVNDPRT